MAKVRKGRTSIMAKQLPSGSWRVNLYLGKDADGNRMFKSFTAATPEQAEYVAAEYRVTHKEKSKPENMTVGEAIDRYIDTKTNVLSPSTINAYRKIRRNNFKPLMPIKLVDLTSEAIQIAVNEEAANHAPKTVANQYGLLTAALRQYHPSFEPVVKLPQKVRSDITIPENDDIWRIMADIRGRKLELAVILAGVLGLRRSEICALTPADYDAKNKLLHVRKAMVLNEDGLWVVKTTKTYAGKRALSVPSALCAYLDAIDPNAETLVGLVPSQITEMYRHVVRRLNISTRFHDLRHYNASVLHSLNVPDKYAMKRMGHATPNMLQSVYQHPMISKQDEITGQINTYMDKLIQHDIQHEPALDQ